MKPAILDAHHCTKSPRVPAMPSFTLPGWICETHD
jgi:hypothetical protein